MTTTSVAVEAVADNPLNPRRRMDESKIEELVQSIKVHGVLQPILVRPADGRYECVFGHRRLRAARKLGMEKIPADVRDIPQSDLLEIMLVENCQREDIHPLEEADTYRQVLDAEIMGVADLAAKVGRSKSHVYQRLQLAALGDAARESLYQGQITAGVGMLLSRLDPERQGQALKDLLALEQVSEAGVIGVRSAQPVLRRYTHDLRHAPFDTADADLVPEAGPCGTCPKRSGSQTDLFGAVAGDEHPETCTDPQCFESKVQANWEQVKARAEAKGHRVADAREVMTEYGMPAKGYVRADGKPDNAHRLRGRKAWKSLVGKRATPVVTLEPRTGKPVELYVKREATKALKPEVKEQLKGAPASAAPKKAKGKDGLTMEDAEEVRLRAVDHAAEGLVEHAMQVGPAHVLRDVVLELVEAGVAEEDAWVAYRRGLTKKDPRTTLIMEPRSLLNAIRECSDTELAGYAAELFLIPPVAREPMIPIDRRFDETLAAYGVDWGAIEKHEREKLLEEKKAAEAEARTKKATKKASKAKSKKKRATKTTKTKPKGKASRR